MGVLTFQHTDTEAMLMTSAAASCCWMNREVLLLNTD